MKKAIKIKPFWYSDVWLFPKLVTVITSLDAQGRLNAAPYSHIMQYDVMHKKPRMILGFRQDSHTFENIVATGEFVINCPPADYLDDVMETARFYPEGVNELEHTRFTPIPSTKVKPPTLKECPQVAECTVDEIIRLEKSSGIVIANIVTILVEEGIEAMGREERIRAMNLPVGLGDADRVDYYYGIMDNIVHHKLKEAPETYAATVSMKTTLPWDEDAMAELMKIPAMVRKMVMGQAEKHAQGKGASRVTHQHMTDLAAEFGMDEAVLARFGQKDKA